VGCVGAGGQKLEGRRGLHAERKGPC